MQAILLRSHADFDLSLLKEQAHIRPILEQILTHLSSLGVRHFLVLDQNLAGAIEQECRNGSHLGVRISYPKKTQAKACIDANNPLILIAVDCFAPCDLNMLSSFHLQRKSKATSALKLQENKASIARVRVSTDFQILVNPKDPDEGYGSAGVFSLNPDMWFTMSYSFGDQFWHSLIHEPANWLGLPVADPILDLSLLTKASRPGSTKGSLFPGNKTKAVFLDRDGIVIKDTGYVHKIEDVCFFDDVFPFCRAAAKAGYELVIVTNQAGIGKGYFSEQDAIKVNTWIIKEFSKRGVTITDVFMCPFHEHAKLEQYRRISLFRKPEPGMFLHAAEKWNIDLTQSLMVGDKESDRIRLPYLKSYIKKSQYQEMDCDFEFLDELAEKLFINGNKNE